MDSVIVFGPDKEDPLDDDLDLPEADIKDRINVCFLTNIMY